MSEVKFHVDNPGGSWLEKHRKRAEENYTGHGTSGKGLSGPTTGYFSRPLKLPVKHLKHIPGAMGEEDYRNDFSSHKHRELSKSVEKHGFNTEGHSIAIGVNHRGKPYVLEGNHRLAHAIKHGHSHIHAEVRYYNGGEDVKGQGFHPDQVLHLHHHGEYKGLREEAPTNSVGGGNVAGLGVGPQGEPAGSKKTNAKRRVKRFKDFIR